MPQNSASAFGCNTYSYILSHTAPDCLKHLAGFGFREFEVMMVPGHCWPAEMDAGARATLRRHLKSLDSKIVTLNMPNIDMNIAGIAPEMRAYTIGILKRIVALAGDLGVPGVIIGPGKANPLFPAPKAQLTGYFFAALDELAPYAKKCGTALWVENMPLAALPTIEDLMPTLDRYGNPDIGIAWDAPNSYFAGEEIAASLVRSAPRLKLVHLSDTGRAVYKHDPIGTGTVPFASLLPALAKVGYRRRTMIELTTATPDADILESVERLVALGFTANAGAA
jgi:L-ribulose-5-phosphate 3-epimerase